MPKSRVAGERAGRASAQGRGRLGRLPGGRRRGWPPALVEPAVCARRARRVAAIVVGLWAAVVVADGLLVRTQLLSDSYLFVSMVVGVLASAVLLPLHYGYGVGPSGRVHLAAGPEGGSLTSRTLSGTRTLDLNRLTRVRRLEARERWGGIIDELRLQDAYGVRLVVGKAQQEIDRAVRQAVESAPARPDRPAVRVTEHARTRLGLAPGPRPRRRILHRFCGSLLLATAFPLLGVAGFVVTDVLARAGA
ncbi:hypothetical protein [Kitasatospora sp. NPDC004272]